MDLSNSLFLLGQMWRHQFTRYLRRQWLYTKARFTVHKRTYQYILWRKALGYKMKKKLLPRWRRNAIIVVVLVAVSVVYLIEKLKGIDWPIINWSSVGKFGLIALAVTIVILILVYAFRKSKTSASATPVSATAAPAKQSATKAGKQWKDGLIIAGAFVIPVVMILLYGKKLQQLQQVPPSSTVPVRSASVAEKFTESPWRHFLGPDRDSLFALVSDTVLRNIAACESHFRQYDDDGKTVFRGTDPNDVGIFQINEKIWGDSAKSAGIDIHTLDGNASFAEHIVREKLKEGKTGYEDWQKSSWCWYAHYNKRPIGYGLPDRYIAGNYMIDTVIIVGMEWSNAVEIPRKYKIQIISLDSIPYWIRKQNGDSVLFIPGSPKLQLGRDIKSLTFKANSDTVVRIRYALMKIPLT